MANFEDIWAVWISTYGRDPASYDLPIFHILVSLPDHVKLLPDMSEDHHKVPFYGISVSMLDDICIPILYDLNFVHCSLKASLSVNFERFTFRGAFI